MGEQTHPENDRYLIDEKEQVWYTPDSNKPVLTVPRSMVSELFVLVHTVHGHAEVFATLAVIHDRFHWLANARDTRLYVSSCGCNRRKRSRSKKIVTMSGRAMKPWETLKAGIFSMETTSRAGNKYVLLVVDRTSRFHFVLSLPSKRTKDFC